MDAREANHFAKLKAEEQEAERKKQLDREQLIAEEVERKLKEEREKAEKKAADDEFRKGKGQGEASAAAEHKPPPRGYEMYFDDEGKAYYHNIVTGSTSYDHPDKYETIVPSMPLKYGWEAYKDDDGKEYYHNIETGVTTYTHPGQPVPEINGFLSGLTGLFAPKPEPAPAHPSAKDKHDERALKEGWEAYSDDEGDTYFHLLILFCSWC